jgi:hypothetical protein
MTTAFLSRGIWSEITKTVRASRRRCFVAVAYFGAGASRRLPLPMGSSLVVDASERAVGCGQTCPADLQKLQARGVAVYSVPNLHAKVFVVGRTAYVGSTNVSTSSAEKLLEAVIRTSEPRTVGAVRKFIDDNCLHELTPELLKRLAKFYRPPRIPDGDRRSGQPKESSSRATLPRLLLAQLELQTWSKRDQQLHDRGLVVAKKRRKHPRSFELESFRVAGKCVYQRRDVVIQVTDEGGGSVLVTPPGNVLHVRIRRDGNSQVSFVYLERPARRRRKARSLARALGCTQKRLLRDGVVRDSLFARDLLRIWAGA